MQRGPINRRWARSIGPYGWPRHFVMGHYCASLEELMYGSGTGEDEPRPYSYSMPDQIVYREEVRQELVLDVI